MDQGSNGSTPPNGNEHLFAGRYLLLDKIGEGGAAVVYRGRDQRLDRVVAVKVLRPQFTTDEASRKRFLNEARTAAGLNHPNVVDIYDFGENPDGSMFIVMQYIEGQNLKDLLHRRGRMTPADVVSIIPQVCQALTAAHSRGLIHRDVKPQNIMIDSRGNVHLTDFGIVKALSGPELTQTGMTFGTAAYLSPEQATGEPVGPPSDVYALGCVMYEMLTGSPPFTGDNPAVVAYKQVWEQPRPLHEWAPEAPPALESIVMRCLNKDPARRYPTTAALATDLGNLGAAFNQPTQAVSLGTVASQAQGKTQPRGARPNAEISRPIPMPASPSAAAVPPVRVQTTNTNSAGGQTTRRVEQPRVATSTAASVPPRVQVVNPSSRVSNAWLPVALVAVVLGVVVCALAASQGNFLSLFAGGSTPTPLPPLPTATALAPLPTPTFGQIVVVTATNTLVPLPTDTQTSGVEATDTPPPTIPAPPTITPEETATDTPQPGEPTATFPSLPTLPIPLTFGPAPTDTPQEINPFTPVPSGTNSVTLDALSFQGGFTNPGGYHQRFPQWVYGQGTQYHTMTASFSIQDKPRGQGHLMVVGVDSEDPPKCQLSITVNGQEIFNGADPLPNDNSDGPNAPGNWGTATFRIDPNILQQGVNTISFTNLNPSDKINYPIFIMIDSVTINW